ncbi:FecR domain-containing protein [Aquimarina addita]|uniref:FecR domain-containing protein n=1 Tax=Aquimarina addita TaxID=870485 RepID=A0ABP7X7F2_9FLAO
MLDDKKDDIFLSRWINEELSEEELRDFQAHPDYEYYLKIKVGTDSLQLMNYDENEALHSIKSKHQKASKKEVKPIIKLWPYAAVAASVAIIFSLFLLNPKSSYTSTYGEQLAVTLPDGSEMLLNAKSEASFNKDNWDTNRTIKLEGEAYFKVKKGSTFTVMTKNGSVSVLGTQFNVQSLSSFFEAVCYEGKVHVESGNDNKILTAGKAYRNINSTSPEQWEFTAIEPSWIHNTSSFRSTPIQYVFRQLEKQYEVHINSKKINTKLRYTGTFPNNDLELALKTVFSTLGIQYELSQDGKIVVLEN